MAVHDPLAPFPIDDIRRVTGLDVERVVATRSDVESLSRAFYGLKSSLKTAEKQLAASWLSVDLGNQEFLSTEQEELDPAAAPVVKALDHILSYAFEQRASDIHFEPKRDATLVRLRIDGVLHEVHLIPKMVYQAIASRIKLLSGCNLAEKRRPQDGRIKREQGGREIEIRVSTMPTAFGEKAVLRIFDPDVLLKQVDELGFSPGELPLFHSFLSRTTGIILVTGPTGSGKTTTLYSALKYLAKPEVNIVTIEDPIEMVHDEFNQVAVRPAIDVTFATALRTVLRQDPDIIMVGEIRDTETAVRRAGGPDRPSRAVDAAHQRRALVHHAAARPEGAGVPDHVDRDRHSGAAAGPRDLHPLHRGIRRLAGGGDRAGRAVRIARVQEAQARARLPSLPADRLQRARRHLRDSSDHRHDSAPGGRAGRQHAAVRGGARRRHAHAPRSGHRQSLPGRHDRQRDGPRHGR